jgi:hypothetical protein
MRLGVLILFSEGDFGMDRRVFKDLLKKTRSMILDTFDFVGEVQFISSALGEVVGKTYPTTFTPVSFEDAATCMSKIGNAVGLQAKKASARSKDSTLFFETLLTGMFGVKDSSTMHVTSLKEILVATLVELWQDRGFRSAVKSLPEVSEFNLSEFRFDLRGLVKRWTTTAGTVTTPVTQLILEVLSHAFDCQFGLVTLSYPDDAYLFLYGKAAARRVYLGTNGLIGAQQKYFYFCGTSSNFNIFT